MKVTTRYAAVCAAHDRGPADMQAIDRERFPGGEILEGAAEETRDYPTMQCPQCRRIHVDKDGFGFLACIPGCGYCTHPSRMGGVCEICGDAANGFGTHT